MDQDKAVAAAQTIANLALIIGGASPLIPLVGGLARSVAEQFARQGIDPGPLSAIADDLDAITADGLADDAAFRQRHGLA